MPRIILEIVVPFLSTIHYSAWYSHQEEALHNFTQFACLPNQTVPNFFYQRHNKPCVFISGFKDYFFAGNDQHKRISLMDRLAVNPNCKLGRLRVLLVQPFTQCVQAGTSEPTCRSESYSDAIP